MKHWLIVIALIFGSAAAFAHQTTPSCEDALLNRVSLYSRLIDLGLEQGWIEHKHLTWATAQDLKIFKISESDSSSYHLAKELSSLVDAMTAAEREAAFALIGRRLNDETRHKEQMNAAEDKLNDIFAPRLLKTLRWIRPLKKSEVSLLLHSRPGQSPLVLMNAENNIQIFDPDVSEDAIQTISKSDVERQISNVSAPFSTSDGRLLVAFNRRVDGRIEYVVKDLISHQETILNPQARLGRTAWIRGADGRDFAVLNDSMATAVFEIKGERHRLLTSKKARFLSLLTSPEGLVRLVTTEDHELQLWNENGDAIDRWTANGQVQSVDAFLTRAGQVVMHAIVSPNYTHHKSVFYKEGLKSGIDHFWADTHRTHPLRDVWHETQSGQLLFASYHAEQAMSYDRTKAENVFEVFDPFARKNFYHQPLWVSGPMHWETTSEGEQLYFPGIGGVVALHWNNALNVFDGEHDTRLTKLNRIYNYVRDLKTRDLMIFSTGATGVQIDLGNRLHDIAATGGDKAEVAVEANQIFYANVDPSHESYLKISLYSLYGSSGEVPP
jgi:hypothetical protein